MADTSASQSSRQPYDYGILHSSVLPESTSAGNRAATTWGLCVHLLDEGQITHLICARLKYDLYDFFRGVLGLLPVLFLV